MTERRTPFRVAIEHLTSEKDFQETVIDLAEARGWLVYHPYDSRRSREGYPDLTLVRAPRVIFAELKTEKGKLSDEQWAWQTALLSCPGVEYHVWRPHNWEEVQSALL